MLLITKTKADPYTIYVLLAASGSPTYPRPTTAIFVFFKASMPGTTSIASPKKPKGTLSARDFAGRAP